MTLTYVQAQLTAVKCLITLDTGVDWPRAGHPLDGRSLGARDHVQGSEANSEKGTGTENFYSFIIENMGPVL